MRCLHRAGVVHIRSNTNTHVTVHSGTAGMISVATDVACSLFICGSRLLQRHVRARLPLVPLISYHLMDSLVFVPIMLGVLFFLFEFFGDHVLAFLVLLVVWGCEVFSAVACRTAHSLRNFPRAFLVCHGLFHVYHLTWPLGFGYLALLASVSAIQVSMFHLWSNFELPAIIAGRVNLQRLREIQLGAETSTVRVGLRANAFPDANMNAPLVQPPPQ